MVLLSSACGTSADAPYREGQRQHDEGELDLAIESYRRAIERDPSNALMFVDLAAAYYGRGDVLEASYGCEKALSLDSENRGASALLARALCDLGRPNEALPHAIQGTQTPAPDTFAIWTLADVFLGVERYDEAERLFGMTIASYRYPREYAASDKRRDMVPPGDLGELRFGMGLACKGQGKTQEALAWFTLALEYLPEKPEISYELGALAERSGKESEALERYRQAIRLDPTFVEAQLRSAVVLYHLGNLMMARDVLLELPEGSAVGAEAAYMLGRIAEERGFMVEALGSYHEARSIDDTMGPAWLREGLLLERLGSASEGLSCLERACEEGSSSAAWMLEVRKVAATKTSIPRP